jgi:hypothetical protein
MFGYNKPLGVRVPFLLSLKIIEARMMVPHPAGIGITNFSGDRQWAFVDPNQILIVS